jgi:shikimate kinase
LANDEQHAALPRAPSLYSPTRVLQSRKPAPDAWDGRPIVLVGLMGVGKSTVGRRLATRLRLPFVDADEEIETAAGMTISEISSASASPISATASGG